MMPAQPVPAQNLPTCKQVTRICFTANAAWNLAHFRLNHMRAVQALGVEVHAAAPPDKYVPLLEREGIQFHPWTIQRRSLNPFRELGSLTSLARIYRQIKPDLVHHYTVKAVLYGTASARLCRVPAIVNAVTGLPYLIISPKTSRAGKTAQWLSMKWYVWSLGGRRTHVVLQNQDDLDLLRDFGSPLRDNATLTRGSGVDLNRFAATPPHRGQPPQILFVGRLLREKGFFELIEAMRHLKHAGCEARLLVCGDVDAGNRSSATKQQCQQWIDEGLIHALERVDDVRPYLRRADVVVLPSYREGTPRALLEAMAMSRPLLTTDVPGCREVVDDQVNGMLVPVKDASALARALQSMLECPERLVHMGQASRHKAEQEFDERTVIQTNLNVYRQLLPDWQLRGTP